MEGLRRSERANKGQPPKRLGFGDDLTELELTIVQTQMERTKKEMELLSLREKELSLRHSMAIESKAASLANVSADSYEDLPAKTSTPLMKLEKYPLLDEAGKPEAKGTDKPIPDVDDKIILGQTGNDKATLKDSSSDDELEGVVNRFQHFQKKLDQDILRERLQRKTAGDIAQRGAEADDRKKFLGFKENPPEPKRVTMTTDEFETALHTVMKVAKDDTRHHTPTPEYMDIMKKFLVRQSVGDETHKFEGNVQEWPIFKAWFENLSDSCGYNNTEKLTVLQKSLVGEARETVRFLLFSPCNVDKVMFSLQERYGQPEHLIRTMIAQVKALPAVKHDKPESLVNFSVTLSNMVAAIETFNHNGYVDNPHLLDELITKLPLTMQIAWSEIHASRGFVTVKTFAEWIGLKAKAANYRLRTIEAAKVEKLPEMKNKKTVATVVSSELREVKEKTPECSLCKGKHFLDKCERFQKLSVDDRWAQVRRHGLCFSCLKPKHSLRMCKESKTCSRTGCDRKHNILLHGDVSSVRNTTLAQNETDNPEESPTRVEDKPAPKDAPLSQGGAIDGEIVAHGHGGSHNQIFMKILPVYVTGPKGTEKVYAFLDEGSTITMMTSSLAERLGLDGPKIPLYWQGAGPVANTDLTSKTVECRVRGLLPNAKEYLMQRVRTVFELNLPRQTVDMSALSRDWRHLADGQVQSLKDAVPELLIGLDNTPLIVSREIIHGPWNAPYLVRTWLGWVVMGKIDGRPINGPKNYSMWERRDDLYEMVKDSFSIDSFGAESLGKAPSREDKRALEIMKRTTHRTDDGRFETGLLWKDGKQPAVPESKEAALRRLHATERKLDRDPELAEAYCAKMEDHIQKKYLVKLTEEDLQVPMENVWYLPHFSVFHPAKKKIRVVFDCAAKSHGFSLNDFLTKGPDLLKSLPGVLENFRKGKYAFTGDIREMFHRVHVRKDDTNYQRILYRGMRRDVEPDEYKMDVMTFGASCSPTLASYVKNVNAEEHELDYPEAVKGILDNTYCDDYLGSADSIEDARKLIRDIVYVQKAGGFDIVNWTANDSRILDTFTDTMKNLASQTLDELDRVLGLWWDSTADIFTFKTQFHRVPAEILSGEKIPTMRDVLRLIMSIFDPLGFLAMFTVKGKMILQEIWRLKIGWDDPIEGIALQHWKTFLDELKTISTVRVSRCYSPNLPQATSVQLHIFGDASEHAYSSVAYLRIVSEINSEIEVSFVCARTKVSPLKSTSIPRLELQAAVMSSRMSAAIRATLDVKIDDVVLWSDSLTVLGWIRSDSRRFKQFVGHRISEIDELTEFRQWRWVPTKLNPADFATRMVKSDFSESSMWFCGPPFLRQLESGWPQEKSETIENKTNDVEVFPVMTNDVEVFTVMTSVEVFRGDQLMPKIERFSQWNRLIRVTATAMICAKYWLDRWKVKKSGGCPPKRPTLTVKDLLAAEKQWFRKIQTEFWAEIETLKRGESVDKQSPLLTLSPTLDSDGILRIDSRLVNSDVGEKYPVILAQKHPATKLLIKDAHERHHHQGREQVVNYLRERFHIPRVRVAVKRAWHECQQCKNQRARPVVPEMAALPRFRVTDSVYPFVRSGVDYFGPLMVKVGRRHEKRWGVLFTCLATRAVHLEIAHSLTTDSAIMAIRRFLGRRGPISDLVCDNGTNLRGADNEFRHLYQALETDRMTEALSERKIDFHFNPPAAPHMGGAWERLIRSVKNVLKDLLKNHVPTDEELLTLFTEVEFIVNGRPLTYVSVEPEDDTALTPNHFLIGRSAANRPIGNFDDGDLVLRKAWRKSQRIADMFWHRWVHEYLPELTRRTKWHQKTRPLKIGDIVVICDEQLPRNSWPLGRVTDVFTAPDGKIRSVMVKTAQGLYRRPVAKLALLDVAEDQQTGLGMGAGAPERGNVGNATTPTSGII